MIELSHPRISVRRQCELIGLNRSTLYYSPATETEFNLELMRRIDEQYTKTPFYGWPRMTAQLRRDGYEVNPKRVRRLMQVMGLQAIYPKPLLSHRGAEVTIYPYLLKDLEIVRPNQVWSAEALVHKYFRIESEESRFYFSIFQEIKTVQRKKLDFKPFIRAPTPSADITYVPMSGGFMYLMEILDWFSRYVLAWQVSNTLEGYFCVKTLEQALGIEKPEIFNTDQGAQFTAGSFTSALEAAGVRN